MKYPFLDLHDANADYMEELKAAAARVIESGRYIGGEEVDRLEHSLATLCAAPHAIGVSNGLDALNLIFEGYKHLHRLHEGDEVIIPANTYIASFLALTHAGLIPVPVDPSPATMNITAPAIKAAITPRTRAILTVDLYGRMAWDNDIRQLVIDHDLLVIEDAAQSIGAQSPTAGLFGSSMAGATGHAGAFSFYPTKNIGGLGDAGAVITHDRQLADAIRALANYGSDRRYHNIYAGYNRRLDPIQAAMLNVKLPHLAEVNARRRQRAEIYSSTISNPLVVTPLLPDSPDEMVWHQYVLRILDGCRDRFRQYLLDNQVETDIHYPTPAHLQPCYADMPHGPLPITERLAGEIVSIPIGDSTRLDLDHPRAIAHIINNFN